MANGTFDGVTSNSSIAVRVVWSSQAKTQQNSSIVTASVQLYKNASYSSRTYGTGTWTLQIGSSAASAQTSVNLYSGAGWVTVVTHQATIAHQANGTCSVSIAASGGISGTSLSSLSCQRTVTLDAIPRASTLCFAKESVNAGEELSFSITRADTSFSHRLQAALGEHTTSLEIADAVNGALTIPLDWLDALPAATQGTVVCTLSTYSGGALVGQSGASFTLVVPESAAPSLQSAEAAVVDGAWGLFVQNKSRAKISMQSAQGAYGSTISAYVVSGVATSQTNEITTPLLTNAGDTVYKCYVIDSRGRKSAAVSCTIRVEAYAPPRLSVSAHRCLQGGTIDADGTYLSVSANFSASSVGGNNTPSASVSFRRAGTETFSAAVPLQSGVDTVVGDGTIDTAASYEVLFCVTDALGGAASYTAQIAPSFRLFNVNASLGGMAVGRMCNRAAMQCALDADFEKSLHVAGELSGANADFSGALSSASLSLNTPLALTSGGVGAADADGARENLVVPQRPKLLWKGSLTGGSITVPGFSDYAIFAVEFYASLVLARVSSGGYLSVGEFDISTDYAGWGTLSGAVMSVSEDTLTLLHNFYVSVHETTWYQSASDNASIPITAIYGLVRKDDLQGVTA